MGEGIEAAGEGLAEERSRLLTKGAERAWVQTCGYTRYRYFVCMYKVCTTRRIGSASRCVLDSQTMADG